MSGVLKTTVIAFVSGIATVVVRKVNNALRRTDESVTPRVIAVTASRSVVSDADVPEANDVVRVPIVVPMNARRSVINVLARGIVCCSGVCWCVSLMG